MGNSVFNKKCCEREKDKDEVDDRCMGRLKRIRLGSLSIFPLSYST
jgi:hypothetical protein